MISATDRGQWSELLSKSLGWWLCPYMYKGPGHYVPPLIRVLPYPDVGLYLYAAITLKNDGCLGSSGPRM
jgi:hypothetical protein